MKINVKNPVVKYKIEMDEKISALSAQINIAMVDKDEKLVEELKEQRDALMVEKLENLPRIKADYRKSKRQKNQS
jgi:hypothetical protein